MNATLTLDAPARLRRPGMVWGVAVSVVLHVLLIFGYRLSAPKALPELPPRETMTVWLMQPQRPAPPPVRIEPPSKPIQPTQRPARRQTEAPTSAVASRPAPAAKPAEPATTATDNPAPQAITPPTPATSPASNAPDPLSPPQQQQQQSQRFDMNAALKTARKVANEKDPARAGLPVAQLDDHPLYPEQNTNELATKIKGAKRESCLNQPGGNLLTPLFWLLEKKDHGCKL